jgi:hypothetical protein
MRITLNLDENEEQDKAKRLLYCDDAFSLIWNIDQLCRNDLKYGSKKTKDEILEEIRNEINETNLLELFL